MLVFLPTPTTQHCHHSSSARISTTSPFIATIRGKTNQHRQRRGWYLGPCNLIQKKKKHFKEILLPFNIALFIKNDHSCKKLWILAEQTNSKWKLMLWLLPTPTTWHCHHSSSPRISTTSPFIATILGKTHQHRHEQDWFFGHSHLNQKKKKVF